MIFRALNGLFKVYLGLHLPVFLICLIVAAVVSGNSCSRLAIWKDTLKGHKGQNWDIPRDMT